MKWLVPSLILVVLVWLAVLNWPNTEQNDLGANEDASGVHQAATIDAMSRLDSVGRAPVENGLDIDAPFRKASASLVFLPVSEDPADPRGRGLQAWIDYREARRQKSLKGGPSIPIIWWTEDSEIVALFLDVLPHHVEQSRALLRERAQRFGNASPFGGGAQYLDEILQLLKEKGNGALSSEYAFFGEQGLANSEASALGAFLRDQLAIEWGTKSTRYPSKSMFAAFSRQLEFHVGQHTKLEYQVLNAAQQQTLREAYAQLLVDVAMIKAQLEPIQMGAVQAAHEMGLMSPSVELQLQNQIPAAAELKNQTDALWARFLEELKRI